MMKISDYGYIVFVKKYEENSLLVKILSKENGLISGYVSHVKNRNIYQIGNYVYFVRTVKNENNLGVLNIELVKSILFFIINNRFNINLIEIINILIINLLYEQYSEKELFYQLDEIFNLLSQSKSELCILKQFLKFKNTILNIIGTGIIIPNSSNLENLHYVSPKTGLAVSKEKGEPFKDKLIKFPIVLKTNNYQMSDIIDCSNVMNYFLKKYLLNNNQDKRYNLILLYENKLF